VKRTTSRRTDHVLFIRAVVFATRRVGAVPAVAFVFTYPATTNTCIMRVIRVCRFSFRVQACARARTRCKKPGCAPAKSLFAPSPSVGRSDFVSLSLSLSLTLSHRQRRRQQQHHDLRRPSPVRTVVVVSIRRNGHLLACGKAAGNARTRSTGNPNLSEIRKTATHERGETTDGRIY